MKRREFLKFFFGVGAFLIYGLKFKITRNSTLIRPPGAIEEDVFIYKCIRCGECIKICPAFCLKPVKIDEGIFEWGTPFIKPRERACLLCLSCGKVCPTGAIQKVKFEEVKIGTAKIDTNRCLVWRENKDCFVCMEVCPVGAVYKNENGKPVVDPEICVGCGQCEQNCPVLGESAIRVTNKGQKRKKLINRR
ncbi:MAG: 4Fe-4S dicluster domain-containing protein [Candidatus Omnitrophica bacterium]|nr:4Fe-4S dicluster domain-containing protein [Candidatus Omnitrophota bacterium]MCM8803085.1 4Fe-4S dicluster domain-containing protein [Candidatus Omnitrophota bacterium]